MDHKDDPNTTDITDDDQTRYTNDTSYVYLEDAEGEESEANYSDSEDDIS